MKKKVSRLNLFFLFDLKVRGVGFIAWRLRRPKKENADGAEGIFGLAGRVWASALRPDPP